METISVIVPVYNEKETVRPFLEGLKENVSCLFSQYEIIVVDDCSTDGSREELASVSDVVVLSNPKRLGYGASLKNGINLAKQESICIIDCDNTYDSRDINRLVAFVKENDMVIGARPQLGGLFSPFTHKLAKWFTCFFLSLCFARKIKDINSGLRIMKKSVLEGYLPLLPNGFSFTSSITLAMLLDRRKICFVSVNYMKRKKGESKICSLEYTINFLRSYIRIIYAKILK